jgi:hypothetical protein
MGKKSEFSEEDLSKKNPLWNPEFQKEREGQELSVKTKEELLLQLTKIHSTQERVKLFGKVMDDYGADALVSIIPEYWDISSSLVSTCYLLYEGSKVWFSLKDTLKILGYQTADILVGAVPVLWDIADYFFKANKWSAKIFQKHFEKIQKRTIAQGLSKSDIQKMQADNAKFVKAMNKAYDTYHNSKNPIT